MFLSTRTQGSAPRHEVADHAIFGLVFKRPVLMRERVSGHGANPFEGNDVRPLAATQAQPKIRDQLMSKLPIWR